MEFCRGMICRVGLQAMDCFVISVHELQSCVFCAGGSQDHNALKAKLRRLMTPNKNGELKVPQWLHDAWKTSDHLKMALQFQSVGFDKDSCFQNCIKQKSLCVSLVSSNSFDANSFFHVES